MLFLVKSAWVEAVTDTKKGEANIRQKFLGGLAHRKGQQLDNRRAQEDAGLADHKKLVDEGDQDDEAHSNEPGSDGAHGH